MSTTVGLETNARPLSFGIGVSVGVSGMLLLGIICLAVVLIFRARVALCLLGVRKKGRTEVVSSNQKETSKSNKTDKPLKKGVELRVPGNAYDGLNPRSGDVSSTYEPIQIYQNTL